MNALITTLHSLAAILWIGGIFFAFMVLRPVSTMLEPPARLQLWSAVFARFFPWVWVFVAVLVVTGYADLYLRFDGLHAPGYLVAMQVIGWIMILLFAWLAFVLVGRLHRAVREQRWPDAGAAMVPIRQIIAINLLLGILITIIGVARPALG
ncbi:CopD family protein [Halothiobacillus sp.]|uniref:CopD family protein n=1 Tax=Halothiobacillus sp. TaxID=1891311 RepID=UPI002AD2B840|nr:CopD family protein [Halothiobacillus sp.]